MRRVTPAQLQVWWPSVRISNVCKEPTGRVDDVRYAIQDQLDLFHYMRIHSNLHAHHAILVIMLLDFKLSPVLPVQLEATRAVLAV
jgi:hypothetical protein